MSDEIKRSQEALVKGLLDSVGGKRGDIDKLKQMTKLAKELGEDTTDAERILDVASDFLSTIEKRLGPKKT